MNFSEIGPALNAAFQFWRTETRRVPGAVALVTLAALAAAVEPALRWPAPVLLVTSIVQLAVGMVGYGALYRLGLAKDHLADAAFTPGPAGLQWTQVEWRLVGANLLTLLLILLAAGATAFVGLLASTVVFAIGGAHASVPNHFFETSPGLTFLGVAVIGGAALIWTLMRLSLSLPATVDRGRVQVFSAWGLTRGHVAPILVSILAIGAPVLLLGIVEGVLKRAGSADPALGLRIVMALVTGLFQFPALTGLLVHFYRRLNSAPPTL